MKRIENNPEYVQQLVKAYDVGDESEGYHPKKLGLRDGEIVTISELTRDSDVECDSLKEEAWETLALMEENGELVDMFTVSVTG